MTSDADTGDLIAIFKIAGHGDHHMRGPVTIGRDPRADEGATVEVDGDPLVSKSHFCVDIDQGDLIVIDLGSSNGTFLHHSTGETVVPSDRWIPIPGGAEIEFGDQRMTIESVGLVAGSDAADDLDAGADPDSDDGAGADADGLAVAVVERDASAAQADPASSRSFWDVADEPAGEHVTCSQCQRHLPPESKFCDGCGTPVISDAERAPTPAQPPVPAESVEDVAGHTVVIPTAQPVPPTQSVPPAQSVPPTQSVSPVAGPAPQYGGPPPQGPPPGQYGQSPPPPVGQAPGVPTDFAGASPGPGAPVFVDPATASSSTTGTGKKVAMAVGAVVVVGLLGFGLVSVLGGENPSNAGEAQTSVPGELDEQWSTGVDAATGLAGVGEDAVYVIVWDDGEVLLTSLDRATGEENWDAEIGEGSDEQVDAAFGRFVVESEDIVVAQFCSSVPEFSCEAVGLDVADGDEAWRRSTGDGSAFGDGSASGDGANFVTADGEGFTLFESETGRRLERARGTSWPSAPGSLLLFHDGEYTAYDRELLPIFGPVEADDDAVAAAFDGERLVVAIGDEIEFVDAEGDSSSGAQLDGDITSMFAVDDSTVVVVLEDEVVVYDIDGDGAVERWSADGTVAQLVQPEGGDVLVITSGEDRVVVDLESGDERFDFEADRETGVSVDLFANAIVTTDRGAASPDGEEASGPATVTAYDWSTGDELWSEDLEGRITVDEIVVVVDSEGDVTAYG